MSIRNEKEVGDESNPPTRWLSRKVTVRYISSNTAQLTSMELVSKLLEVLRKEGVEIMEGMTVQGLERKVRLGDKGVVTGVLVKGQEQKIIPCDAVVFCCGPWTGALLEQWFEDDELKLPMEGIKSTSFIYNPGSFMCNEMSLMPLVLFCDEDRRGSHLEVYPRPDGSTYICGCGGSDHVRADRLSPGGDCDAAHKIKADLSRVAAATHSLEDIMARGIIPSEPDVVQACMRPCPQDGLPYMGSFSAIGATNVFVSAGHNCWGICWALVSGKAIAELVVTGKSLYIDLDAFDPLRYTTHQVQRRGRYFRKIPVGEQW